MLMLQFKNLSMSVWLIWTNERYLAIRIFGKIDLDWSISYCMLVMDKQQIGEIQMGLIFSRLPGEPIN